MAPSTRDTGMRCAEFHIDPRDDDPGPRCGHTLTCVPVEGGGERRGGVGGAWWLGGNTNWGGDKLGWVR